MPNGKNVPDSPDESVSKQKKKIFFFNQNEI